MSASTRMYSAKQRASVPLSIGLAGDRARRQGDAGQARPSFAVRRDRRRRHLRRARRRARARARRGRVAAAVEALHDGGDAEDDEDRAPTATPASGGCGCVSAGSAWETPASRCGRARPRSAAGGDPHRARTRRGSHQRGDRAHPRVRRGTVDFVTSQAPLRHMTAQELLEYSHEPYRQELVDGHPLRDGAAGSRARVRRVADRRRCSARHVGDADLGVVFASEVGFQLALRSGHRPRRRTSRSSPASACRRAGIPARLLARPAGPRDRGRLPERPPLAGRGQGAALARRRARAPSSCSIRRCAPRPSTAPATTSASSPRTSSWTSATSCRAGRPRVDDLFALSRRG